MPFECITLFNEENTQYKICQVAIVRKDIGFGVNQAFGPSVSSLQFMQRTLGPVTFVNAAWLYDKLVKDLLAKGYSRGLSSNPHLRCRPERKPDVE